jgi:hypothetical protein
MTKTTRENGTEMYALSLEPEKIGSFGFSGVYTVWKNGNVERTRAFGPVGQVG